MKRLIFLTITCSLIFCACQKQASTQKHPPTKIVTQKEPSKLVKMTTLKKADKKAPYAELGSTVLVHYTGWIANSDNTPGRQIDSSIERKKPLQFTVGLHQVIKGFEEAITRMQVGQKCRVIIPSELAYGEHGVGLFIPPHATLIFDIELLAMK